MKLPKLSMWQLKTGHRHFAFNRIRFVDGTVYELTLYYFNIVYCRN